MANKYRKSFQLKVPIKEAKAKAPEVLLLDEPFSSIYTFRKNSLRRNLFAYLKKHDISCITATPRC
ncbi:hypothetical protein [Marinirhabdus gelatinilytica]|uniref:ABC transporter family protein n=1 Tax=Marinirhabdus gelatinilytica TaxID=1703343 RepID=A0A370QK50_9FLAO|nr:hypothetical protein [Marinirhabdus gelatinilytica]RDK88440.1 hypothetical protein C8D94_101312 [Marinirhabdus gelatinilytica]